MANQSILAAFERMWQHIVYALGEKSDKSHTHSGYMTTASPTGTGALSLNRRSNTTVGDNSSAVGFNVAATATAAHAEGSTTTASGGSAHAEGTMTTASGSYAHSEGQGTTASGESSHAEGNYTIASGYASHAEGDYTMAASDYQHVQGKNNIVDSSGTYAHIVGNGESDTSPSNAHTLDWNGNAWFAGDIKIGGTGYDDTAALLLATQEFVLKYVPKVTSITLYADDWMLANGVAYYQDVVVSCVTPTSKVDLQPTYTQLAEWQSEGLAFTTVSANGVVRVWATDGTPREDCTVQITVQEVLEV